MGDRLQSQLGGNKAGQTAANAVATIDIVVGGGMVLWATPKGCWEISAKKVESKNEEPGLTLVDEVMLKTHKVTCPRCGSSDVTTEWWDDRKGNKGMGCVCEETTCGHVWDEDERDE